MYLGRACSCSQHVKALPKLSPSGLIVPQKYSKSIRYASGLVGANSDKTGSMGEEAEDTQESNETPHERWSPMVFKMLESAATTFTSVLVLA